MAELATLAGGQIEPVLAQLPDDDPIAQRLRAIKSARDEGADMRTAIARVYGDHWATRAERNEIVALLAGADNKVRWRLSAISHAEVKIEWPHGTETDVADALRLALKGALPVGANDDGPRGFLLVHRLTSSGGPTHDNALIEGTKMKSFPFESEASLLDVDGTEIAHYSKQVNMLGVSSDNALQAFGMSAPFKATANDIVDKLVSHVLTDAETSVRR